MSEEHLNPEIENLLFQKQNYLADHTIRRNKTSNMDMPSL